MLRIMWTFTILVIYTQIPILRLEHSLTFYNSENRINTLLLVVSWPVNPLTTIVEKERKKEREKENERERAWVVQKGQERRDWKLKCLPGRDWILKQLLFLNFLLESFGTLVDLGRCTGLLSRSSESRFSFEWIRWWEISLSLSWVVEFKPKEHI